MSPAWLFVALLLLTVALLVSVVATGLRAARRLHITLVVITIASLAATIWAAERLGETLDLSEAGAIVPVHLTLAKLATAAYVLPVATGIATLRRARWRMWHRSAALLTLALTVAAAVTGVWMALAAEPRRDAVGLVDRRASSPHEGLVFDATLAREGLLLLAPAPSTAVAAPRGLNGLAPRAREAEVLG